MFKVSTRHLAVAALIGILKELDAHRGQIDYEVD